MIVVLAVVLILSTIVMFLYQKSLAYAKGTVCQTNLKALHKAIILYSQDNDVLPATLGDLNLEHLEKGYAKVMEDRGWLIKASTYLIKLDASDHAYAQFLTYENLKEYGAGKRIFRCPADRNGGTSYGINGNIGGKRWTDINEYVIVVADNDNHVFYTLDELSKRHSHMAFASNKRGTLMTVEEDQIVPVVNNDPEPPAEENTEENTENNFPTDLDGSVTYFNDLVNNNIDTPIADKAEDVRNKLLTALDELSKSPPDISAAQGNIDGAEGDLQAMIDDGLIDPENGAALLTLFSDISSQL